MKTSAAHPVVIVEDDASVRVSLTRLLRSAGRHVVAYASAEEFLGRDRRDEPCCLLLSIDLGGMSGVDLAERLARDNAAIPVVFITAVDDLAFGEEHRQPGVVYLRKPFDEATLIQSIEAAMAGRTERSAGLE
jgi:FixJ family two-component response regulator